VPDRSIQVPKGRFVPSSAVRARTGLAVAAALGFGVLGATACDSSASDGSTANSEPAGSTPAATREPSAPAPTGATADAAASRVSRAVRALKTARERVSHGRPYDLETERYKGNPVWEVKVASGNQRPHKLYVAANGKKVVRSIRAKRIGDDAPKVLGAKVSLTKAIRTADKRAGGRFSEAEIDRTDGGTIVWQVTFKRSGERETEVIVNAKSGKAIGTETGVD
jgi:uncharacterized membrane protein YkoI